MAPYVKGYGLLRPGGGKRAQAAHRVSYELHVGPIPDGHGVLHRCDVPGCVNPQHLFTGTNGDNNTDRASKGRSASGDRHGTRTRPDRIARGDRHSSKTRPDRVPRGERSGSAKLSYADVIEIRRSYAAKEMSQYALARKFNVTQANISIIVLRKSRVSA